jgi:hypothetical protein
MASIVRSHRACERYILGGNRIPGCVGEIQQVRARRSGSVATGTPADIAQVAPLRVDEEATLSPRQSLNAGENWLGKRIGLKKGMGKFVDHLMAQFRVVNSELRSQFCSQGLPSPDRMSKMFFDFFMLHSAALRPWHKYPKC